MSTGSNISDQEWKDATQRYAAGKPTEKEIVRAGLIGGLIGGITIWIYEALVWVGAQHLMSFSGIPPNATGFCSLRFGPIFAVASMKRH